MEHEYLTPGIVNEVRLLQDLLAGQLGAAHPRPRRRRRPVAAPAPVEEAEAIRRSWPRPAAVDPSAAS